MTLEEQKKYNKEVYYWRKSHGYCIRCGRNKPQENRTQCLECARKSSEVSLAWHYRKKGAKNAQL